LRLQLLGRAPSRYVFPKREGGPWTYRHWRKLIWDKARERARKAWRERDGLDDEAPTPFCELTPHDLRSTAATLMRDAGFSREEAAARLGHADTGQLLDRVYDPATGRPACARRFPRAFGPSSARAHSGPLRPPRARP
jgi:integrase